jgi:hypothetical protein
LIRAAIHERAGIELAWRDFLLETRWTHTAVVNPLLPWLDQMSIQQVCDRVLERLSDRLRASRRFGAMIPEQDPTGMWHIHGLIAVPGPAERTRLERHGERWIRRAVERWTSHRSPEASHGRCAVLVRPIGTDPAAAIHYANKRWLHGLKGELIRIR